MAGIIKNFQLKILATFLECIEIQRTALGQFFVQTLLLIMKLTFVLLMCKIYSSKYLNTFLFKFFASIETSINLLCREEFYF